MFAKEDALLAEADNLADEDDGLFAERANCAAENVGFFGSLCATGFWKGLAKAPPLTDGIGAEQMFCETLPGCVESLVVEMIEGCVWGH